MDTKRSSCQDVSFLSALLDYSRSLTATECCRLAFALWSSVFENNLSHLKTGCNYVICAFELLHGRWWHHVLTFNKKRVAAALGRVLATEASSSALVGGALSQLRLMFGDEAFIAAFADEEHSLSSLLALLMEPGSDVSFAGIVHEIVALVCASCKPKDEKTIHIMNQLKANCQNGADMTDKFGICFAYILPAIDSILHSVCTLDWACQNWRFLFNCRRFLANLLQFLWKICAFDKAILVDRKISIITHLAELIYPNFPKFVVNFMPSDLENLCPSGPFQDSDAKLKQIYDNNCWTLCFVYYYFVLLKYGSELERQSIQGTNLKVNIDSKLSSTQYVQSSKIQDHLFAHLVQALGRSFMQDHLRVFNGIC
jgi:hypothetical protein